MRTFDIEFVREHLDDLVEEVAAGNPFIITVKGIPKAKVVPMDYREERKRKGKPRASRLTP